MNPLDATIGYFAPGWAAKRVASRQAIEVMRGYDAAKVGRRTDGWLDTDRGPSGEVGAAAFRVRRRARDLVRNNPWAQAAIRKLAIKVIGTGITPRLETEDQGLRRKASDLWERFAEGCDPEGRLDFASLCQLAERAAVADGEALVRFLPMPSSSPRQVPLRLQVLESDYLDASRNWPTEDGGAVIQGVQYNRLGERIAYWLFDHHPLEAYPRHALAASRPVPASEILHLFEALRPGQVRGISAFAAVVTRLRDLDDFDEATLWRKKVAACFAAFVKRSGTAGTPLANGATTDGSGRRIERMSPGLIQYLQAGEDVTFNTPPGSDGDQQYLNYQLHAIAAGSGITYEMLTGDLSQVNYSSLRAGMIDFWDFVESRQWNIAVPQLCRPVYRRVMALGQAMGRLPSDIGVAEKWTPPRKRWTDPVKEVAALRDEVRSGFRTLPDAIAELGEDPEEHLLGIQRSNELLDKLGITLDSDPRKSGATRPARDAAPAGEGS